MRHRAVALLAGLALSAPACARPPDPASATCLHVLARRLPEAKVLDVQEQRGASALVHFELGAGHAEGRLACTVERTGSDGGWRIRSATLDGVALTEAELAVVNADLFLSELARAGSQ